MKVPEEKAESTWKDFGQQDLETRIFITWIDQKKETIKILSTIAIITMAWAILNKERFLDTIILTIIGLIILIICAKETWQIQNYIEEYTINTPETLEKE